MITTYVSRPPAMLTDQMREVRQYFLLQARREASVIVNQASVGALQLEQQTKVRRG